MQELGYDRAWVRRFIAEATEEHAARADETGNVWLGLALGFFLSYLGVMLAHWLELGNKTRRGAWIGLVINAILLWWTIG